MNGEVILCIQRFASTGGMLTSSLTVSCAMPLNLIFCTWSTASLRVDVTSSPETETGSGGLHIAGRVLSEEIGENAWRIEWSNEGRLPALVGV